MGKCQGKRRNMRSVELGMNEIKSNIMRRYLQKKDICNRDARGNKIKQWRNTPYKLYVELWIYLWSLEMYSISITFYFLSTLIVV